VAPGKRSGDLTKMVGMCKITKAHKMLIGSERPGKDMLKGRRAQTRKLGHARSGITITEGRKPEYS